MASEEKKSRVFSLTEIVLVALAVVFLVLSFFYNDQIIRYITGLRSPALNWLMLFMTKEGLAAITALAAAVLLLKKRYVEFTLILLAVICGLEAGYLLKKIIQMPRPFDTAALSDVALKYTTGYSFPSLHAEFCFSVIPFLGKSFRNRWAALALGLAFLLVAFSRIYLGLHYLTDLLAGGLIGFFSAKFWLFLDARYDVGRRLVRQIRENLELRRQIAHALAGIILIILVKVGLITVPILAAVFVGGMILILLAKNYRIPFIHHALKVFERDRDIRLFPGRGAFFFVLGSLLALLFFERQIALASIAVMAVGDAVTTVVGIYFGRFRNPFNPVKHLEGTMLAIIMSTLAAFTFVDFHMAFFGAAAGIAIESIAFRFFDRVIDDNLLIPLVAGVVMTALM